MTCVQLCLLFAGGSSHLGKEVENMQGGWQSNKIEGAWASAIMEYNHFPLGFCYMGETKPHGYREFSVIHS